MIVMIILVYHIRDKKTKLSFFQGVVLEISNLFIRIGFILRTSK